MEKYERWSWKQQEEYENDLDTIYSVTTNDGFENDYSEERAEGIGLYGELTHEAVEHMMHKFYDHFHNPDGVFYDLGSGTGKVVCHVALGSGLSKACGVEFDKVRFDKSVNLANKISFPRVEPEFINDDFFVQDYSDATVMYFDNAMWDEHFEADKKLTEKLFETIQPGTLILSKEPIAHTLGHKKYVDLPTSYNWSRGYALIFLAIEP